MTTVKIIPDQVSYIAGDLLTGKVVLSITAIPLVFKELSIELVGNFDLKFLLDASVGQEVSSASGVILNREKIVLASEGNIQAGTYEYPFKIPIPKEAFGSCFEIFEGDLRKKSTYYELKYKLRCIVDTGHPSLVIKDVKEVKIHEIFNQKVSMVHEKVVREFTSKVFSSEYLSVYTRITQQVCHPEDSFQIELAIANGHKMSVTKISVALFKEVTMLALTPRGSSLTLRKKLVEEELEGLPPYSSGRRDFMFEIPPDVDLKCTSTHIKVYHFLKFKFHKKVSGLDYTIPVHIVGHQMMSQAILNEHWLNPMTLPPPVGVGLLFSGRRITGSVSPLTAAYYYVDIDNDTGSVELNILAKSDRGVIMRLRIGRHPTYRSYLVADKKKGKEYSIVLNSNSKPKLETGRYYLQVVSRSALKTAEYSLFTTILLDGRPTSNILQSREYSPYYYRKLEKKFLRDNPDSATLEFGDDFGSSDADENVFSEVSPSTGISGDDNGSHDTSDTSFNGSDSIMAKYEIGDEVISFDNT